MLSKNILDWFLLRIVLFIFIWLFFWFGFKQLSVSISQVCYNILMLRFNQLNLRCEVFSLLLVEIFQLSNCCTMLFSHLFCFFIMNLFYPLKISEVLSVTLSKLFISCYKGSCILVMHNFTLCNQGRNFLKMFLL